MCKSLLEMDLENRDRELKVLKTLIEYLSNRQDDKADPNPEFKKQEDYGFVSDLIVLLCPLHRWFVGSLPKGGTLKNRLSAYLRENCDIQFGNLADYDNEQCLANLKEFHQEKRKQYEDLRENRSYK